MYEYFKKNINWSKKYFNEFSFEEGIGVRGNVVF